MLMGYSEGLRRLRGTIETLQITVLGKKRVVSRIDVSRAAARRALSVSPLLNNLYEYEFACCTLVAGFEEQVDNTKH